MAALKPTLRRIALFALFVAVGFAQIALRAAPLTLAGQARLRRILNVFLSSTTPLYSDSWAMLDFLYSQSETLHFGLYNRTDQNLPRDRDANINAFQKFSDQIMAAAEAYRNQQVAAHNPLLAHSQSELSNIILNFARTQQALAGRLYTTPQADIRAQGDLTSNPLLSSPYADVTERNRFLGTRSFGYSLKVNPLSAGGGIKRDKMIAFIDSQIATLNGKRAALVKSKLIEQAELYGFALKYKVDIPWILHESSSSLKKILSSYRLAPFESYTDFAKLQDLSFDFLPTGAFNILVKNHSSADDSWFGSINSANFHTLLATRDLLALLSPEYQQQLVRYVMVGGEEAVVAGQIKDLAEIRKHLVKMPSVTADALKQVLKPYFKMIHPDQRYRHPLRMCLGIPTDGTANADINRYILGRHLRKPGIWSTLASSPTGSIPPIAEFSSILGIGGTGTYKSFAKFLSGSQDWHNSGEDPDVSMQRSFENWMTKWKTNKQKDLDSIIVNHSDPLRPGIPLFAVTTRVKSFNQVSINIRTIDDFEFATQWHPPLNKKRATFGYKTIAPLQLGAANQTAIPSPDHHELISIKVSLADGTPLIEETDYIIRSMPGPRFGYEIYFLKPGQASIHINAKFSQVESSNTGVSPKLASLDPKRLTEVAKRMAVAGPFSLQHDEIKNTIVNHIKDKAAISVIDISNSFDRTSLYSERRAFTPEARYAREQFSGSQSIRKRREGHIGREEYERTHSSPQPTLTPDPDILSFRDLFEFVGRGGYFHGQCHASNSLYTRFMSQIFENDPNLTVRIKKVINLDSTGRYLVTPFHVVTEFEDRATNQVTVVDATPKKLSPNLASQHVHPLDASRVARERGAVKSAAQQESHITTSQEHAQRIELITQSYHDTSTAYMDFSKAYPIARIESATNPWPTLSPFLKLVQSYLETGDETSIRTYAKERGLTHSLINESIVELARDSLQKFEIYQIHVQRTTLPSLEKLRYLDPSFSQKLTLHLYQLTQLGELNPAALNCQTLVRQAVE